MIAVYSAERFPEGVIGLEVLCGHIGIVMVINLIINFIMQGVFSQLPWFAGSTHAKRKRTVLYVLSTVNAILGAAYGVHHYVTGSNEETVAKNELIDRGYWIVCVVGGYVLQDLLMLLVDWRENKQDIFHHLSVLFLAFGGTYTMPTIYPVLPAFALQELSTPFLNLGWFCKEFKAIGDAINQSHLKIVFAILFCVCRVVWFPLETYRVRDCLIESPFICYGLMVFCGLQFYWFVLIVKKVAGGASSGKKKKKSSTAVKEKTE